MVKVLRNDAQQYEYPAGAAIREQSGTLVVIDNEDEIIAMHQQWDFAFVDVPVLGE